MNHHLWWRRISPFPPLLAVHELFVPCKVGEVIEPIVAGRPDVAGFPQS